MSNRLSRKSNLFLAFLAAALAACSPQAETPQRPTEAASAARTEEEADVHNFTIGELPAVALRDGALRFPNDNKIFGVGRTREEVSALLADAGLATDELHLSIQPLLVKAGDRILLFDTGAGANLGSSGGKLPASIAAAAVDPRSVTDIFISHAHGDHVGGLLNAEKKLAFPNATIHISAPDWAFLSGMDAAVAASVVIAQHAELIAAMAPKVVTFAPGADLIAGVVKAVETSGHTPGHSGYLITSGQNSLLYVGDSMHHFVVSVQRSEWPIEFDMDEPAARTSRRNLVAQSAVNGQRIYAVHFPFPGLGKIERRADGFVWVAQ